MRMNSKGIRVFRMSRRRKFNLIFSIMNTVKA